MSSGTIGLESSTSVSRRIGVSLSRASSSLSSSARGGSGYPAHRGRPSRYTLRCARVSAVTSSRGSVPRTISCSSSATGSASVTFTLRSAISIGNYTRQRRV